MEPRYIANFDSRDLPQEHCEVLVIGSGIAGLYTAIKASRFAKVTLLTKRKLQDSSTERAQGGIAAAIDIADSPSFHRKDTLEAGAGLCDPEAVEILVNEGPKRVMELIEWGANFDRTDDVLSLTREGAHSRRRILHAGDATGEEIHRTLTHKVFTEKKVQVFVNHFVIDLLTKNDSIIGALVIDINNRMKIFWGKVVILASGGAGQVYKNTTNPEVVTGDGIAFAYRAGAEVMDMEFVQFHPTALYIPGAPRFLLSEALRGEGAILRNSRGDEFMSRYHSMADLAPRDIVTRAIVEEMEKTKSPNVYLDMTHLDPEKTKNRFPNITQTCTFYGIDITKEMIPVAPAAHYFMGGVKTNTYGETNIKGLYACGEVACLAVHGANRLASNSLLDGLVFGDRIVKRAKDYLKDYSGNMKESIYISNEPVINRGLKTDTIKLEIQEMMWDKVGIIRSGRELEEAIRRFEELEKLFPAPVIKVKEMELLNLLLVGKLIARAALDRTESRGGHFRKDYPQRDDIKWQRHLVYRRK